MFSKATEYALRASIFIAQKGTPEKKISIDEIANAIGSPQSFTAKILQQLRRNNKLICSVPGPNGGFYMTEKAKDLPVRSVLEAMGEDEILNKCVLGLRLCSDVKPCPMHLQYKQIKQELIKLFASRTIGDLANDIEKSKVFINNNKK